MSTGTEPGYLGVAHRPFTPDGAGRENLRAKFATTKMDERRDLLGKFDSVRRDIDASGTMKGLDAFTQRAFDMIASGTVRKALDLKHEEPRTLDRYKGVETFLTARRLIEAGVGCVTLSYGGWDTHTSNFKELKKQLPPAIWSQLEKTYAAADIGDNWRALMQTLALFRQIGLEVAAGLGYAYPLELDERVNQLPKLDRFPGR